MNSCPLSEWTLNTTSFGKLAFFDNLEAIPHEHTLLTILAINESLKFWVDQELVSPCRNTEDRILLM